MLSNTKAKVPFMIFTMIVGALLQTSTLFEVNYVDALTGGAGRDVFVQSSKAPVIVSGDNVYVTWWSNKTGNDEVMFRASNDGGLSFGDKINLSNTTTSESVDTEIAADGDNVYVTWWERNSTDNEPVLRISSDGGQTFALILELSVNGSNSESSQNKVINVQIYLKQVITIKKSSPIRTILKYIF